MNSTWPRLICRSQSKVRQLFSTLLRCPGSFAVGPTWLPIATAMWLQLHAYCKRCPNVPRPPGLYRYPRRRSMDSTPRATRRPRCNLHLPMASQNWRPSTWFGPTNRRSASMPSSFATSACTDRDSGPIWRTTFSAQHFSTTGRFTSSGTAARFDRTPSSTTALGARCRQSPTLPPEVFTTLVAASL